MYSRRGSQAPHWAKQDFARRSYNARSETVAQRPSFRSAWRQRQLGIVPVQAFFEPNYESGKPVRWRIERNDGQPFGLAAIWEQRRRDDGTNQWSFSMLTINADEHALMRRFHRPGSEKRSIVMLADDDWNTWLNARSEEEARRLIRPFKADLMCGQPDPRPLRQAQTGV